MRLKPIYIFQIVLVLCCIMTWSWFLRPKHAVSNMLGTYLQKPIGEPQLTFTDDQGKKHVGFTDLIGKKLTPELMCQIEMRPRLLMQIVTSKLSHNDGWTKIGTVTLGADASQTATPLSMWKTKSGTIGFSLDDQYFESDPKASEALLDYIHSFSDPKTAEQDGGANG